jgi:KRAB domain-containing zinc finger protein
MKFFKKIRCDMCENSFASDEEAMQHKQVVHGKDLPYDCKECNQNFSNMQDMRTHLQRHHNYNA